MPEFDKEKYKQSLIAKVNKCYELSERVHALDIDADIKADVLNFIADCATMYNYKIQKTFLFGGTD